MMRSGRRRQRSRCSATKKRPLVFPVSRMRFRLLYGGLYLYGYVGAVSLLRMELGTTTMRVLLEGWDERW